VPKTIIVKDLCILNIFYGSCLKYRVIHFSSAVYYFDGNIAKKKIIYIKETMIKTKYEVKMFNSRL
jgi:hypothetical protein